MIVETAHGQIYGHASDLAAELSAAGIPNAHDRLRDWIRRGLVTARLEFDGRPVYALADVHRVELSTRRNGKRGQKVDKILEIAHAVT